MTTFSSAEQRLIAEGLLTPEDVACTRRVHKLRDRILVLSAPFKGGPSVAESLSALVMALRHIGERISQHQGTPYREFVDVVVAQLTSSAVDAAEEIRRLRREASGGQTAPPAPPASPTPGSSTPRES